MWLSFHAWLWNSALEGTSYSSPKATWKIFFRASNKVCTSAHDKFNILLNSLVSFFLSGVAQCFAGQHVCIALLFYHQIVSTHMALYIMHFHVLMQTCLLLSIEMVGYCCMPLQKFLVAFIC
jgi:hypothetical protein